MAVPGFGEIAEQLRRSTVLVTASERGAGSGIIWSNDGVVVTNAHVIRGSRAHIQLWDGREFEAQVRSRDPRRDLAQLRIDATDLPSTSLADSSQVRSGDLAIAIGNPLGFVGALATGVIHAVGPVNGLGPYSWVQADVRLAAGNSGGPLADAQGRIIGVNTMVAGRLALAIPGNDVRNFLSGDTSRAWLGVTVHPATIPQPSGPNNVFGPVILEVEPGSPAASASLLTGDILLGSDDKPFSTLEDLEIALRGAGERLIRLEFLRGDYNEVRNVTVRLEKPVTREEFRRRVIRAFIVAASSLTGAGLENLLIARGIEVAGSNRTIDALAEKLSDALPDVILIDSSGEAFEPLLDSLLSSGIASDFRAVVLADAISRDTLADAMRAGIGGILPSDISPDQLVAALHAAACGLIVQHPEYVSAGFSNRPGVSPVLDELAEPLTPRESEVLQMLASGIGNKEIASRLNISEHTVKFHVASILGKLGAGSRTEAVSIGIRRGLVLL